MRYKPAVEARPRLLIAEPVDFTRPALDLLSNHFDLVLGDADLADAMYEYDAVWVRLQRRIDADVLGAAPRCRFIATPVTGLDRIDLAACERLGVQVLALKGETEFLRTVRATAEMTMALLLALLRQLPSAVEDTLEGRWDRDRFRGREIFGKTAGIVGMGRLGSIVAEYLRAMGMNVVGVDPRDDFPHALAERVTLHELLERSDVISLHVPYEPATRHLLGADAFTRAKEGAVLVNTSRGGVVDEAAMVAALESGRLAGAAVDVLDGEPDISAEHPVLRAARRLPNLLVTPHLGGNTFESFEKTELFLAKKLVRAFGGDCP